MLSAWLLDLYVYSVQGLTSLPVKFSSLSRNMSAQINTAMSPHTRQILPLVPRPRKVRRKGRKTVRMGARVQSNFSHISSNSNKSNNSHKKKLKQY
jgi:hypothetical protein